MYNDCVMRIVDWVGLVDDLYLLLFCAFFQTPTQRVYQAKYEKYVDLVWYFFVVGLYELWRRAKTRLS